MLYCFRNMARGEIVFISVVFSNYSNLVTHRNRNNLRKFPKNLENDLQHKHLILIYKKRVLENAVEFFCGASRNFDSARA